MSISARRAPSPPRRSRLFVSVLLVAFAAGGYPLYAAAQGKPVAGKKTPPKKKKKGDPAADSASASASTPPPPPPTPDPEPTATASTSAAPEVTSAAPPPPALPAEPTSQPGAWKRTYGWVSIGAGALFLGGGFLFYKLDKNLNDSAGYHAYARAIAPSKDVCDEARNGTESGYTGALSAAQVKSLCSKGKTYFVAELASFGLGVVGVGLGVYWLLTAPSKEKPAAAWTLLPRIGSAPGVDFAVRF